MIVIENETLSTTRANVVLKITDLLQIYDGKS